MSEPRPDYRRNKVRHRELVLLEPTDANLSAFVLKDREAAWGRVGQHRFQWIIEAYVGQKRNDDQPTRRYRDSTDWYLCRCACDRRFLVPITVLTISKTGLTNRCKRTCGCQTHRPAARWELSPTVINQIAGLDLAEWDRMKKVAPSKQKTPESRAARANLKDMMKMADDELPPGMTREDLEWQQSYLKKFQSRIGGR